MFIGYVGYSELPKEPAPPTQNAAAPKPPTELSATGGS
jgi:hypothetical protein